MTATMTNNHVARPPRRSLNDTIGRLDAMIDGLSDAIPDTIRDTLQEAVGAAVTEGVRTALLEVLSNPEVLTLIRGTVAPAPPPAAIPVTATATPLTVLVTAGSAVAFLARRLRAKLASTLKRSAQCACTALHRLVTLRQKLQPLVEARKPILLAFAVGGLAAVAALFAPNWVAATLSGLGGASIALAVQAGLWLRQHFSTCAVTNT